MWGRRGFKIPTFNSTWNPRYIQRPTAMKRSKMPPRKEPKEQVVYAASKRKAPPFKPQRPSQVPRIPTTESESSRTGAARKPAAAPRNKKVVPSIVDESGDEDEDVTADADKADSGSDLEDGLPASRPAKPSKIFKPPAPAPAKRKTTREPSPMDISSDDAVVSPPLRPTSARSNDPPAPSQAEHPVIPQPLLIRLLHEHFANPATKIDKHAIQVLEKYLEVFVRETIARATLQKEDAAKAGGGDSGLDTGWLEQEDLEKVAAGMMLDF